MYKISKPHARSIIHHLCLTVMLYNKSYSCFKLLFAKLNPHQTIKTRSTKAAIGTTEVVYPIPIIIIDNKNIFHILCLAPLIQQCFYALPPSHEKNTYICTGSEHLLQYGWVRSILEASIFDGISLQSLSTFLMSSSSSSQCTTRKSTTS